MLPHLCYTHAGNGGIEALLALQELPCPPKVIFVSSCEPDEEICRAVETGAAAARKFQPSLSRRELEILGMVAKGLTNKEIGRAIQVSHFTVRNHVRHIIAKLEVGGCGARAGITVSSKSSVRTRESPEIAMVCSRSPA